MNRRLTDAPHVEDVYDALKAVVAHCGGSKAVGSRMWPHKSPDKAGEHLANCLNRHRDEKLDPEQILLLLRLGHEVGYHDAKHWIDQETGYTPSQPRDVEDTVTATVREAMRSLEVSRQAAARLEKTLERSLAVLERREQSKR